MPETPPLEIPALPAVVPPLEIPEEVFAGVTLNRIAFDREFDSPVMLATVPEGEGEQVIAMQRGEFCAVKLDGSGEWRVFLDFRKRMEGLTLFEEGVHGIAFHPQFETNRLFYLSYTQNEPRRTVISEMRATPGSAPVALPESERIVLEIPQPLADHWGGHISFGPDGFLYIALGDGGLRNDPYRLAQNPWVLHGKILRLDVNRRTGKLPYGIPADNPFANDQLVRPEIYALGLRNPWGLSFDTHTGHLWCADVGQDLWEEINLIKKGANYGWSDRDGPVASGFHPGPLMADTPFTEPVHAYTRQRGEGICIVGGLLYRGEKMPALEGSFLFADWGYGTVWALEMDSFNERATRRLLIHRKPEAMKLNPTLITADAEGEPVVLSQEGNLYRLEYGEEVAALEE
ncbi:PQQ-dependent sugar dehydrogenase [Prosthecobacter sp. SYSU 5D2]|uniref:PQQ-dependent sugar dehydrogenase n=1 Tax=Prosthecobacter sp. SYSU 5D2 TaxID=3134134 RepID=UPI0031FECEE4